MCRKSIFLLVLFLLMAGNLHANICKESVWHFDGSQLYTNYGIAWEWIDHERNLPYCILDSCGKKAFSDDVRNAAANWNGALLGWHLTERPCDKAKIFISSTTVPCSALGVTNVRWKEFHSQGLDSLVADSAVITIKKDEDTLWEEPDKRDDKKPNRECVIKHEFGHCFRLGHDNGIDLYGRRQLMADELNPADDDPASYPRLGDRYEAYNTYLTEGMQPPARSIPPYLPRCAKKLISGRVFLPPHVYLWREGFEGSWPPPGWTVIKTSTDSSGSIPGYWSQTSHPVHTGAYAVGLFWSYDHQDEWLITPPLYIAGACTLSFWTYGYEGSTDGDHYYVKVSTDGGSSWDVVFDMSALPGNRWNEWNYPYYIDLSAYAGKTIKIAWHADDPPSNDGLRYMWFIDDVCVTSYAGPDSVTVIPFNPQALTIDSLRWDYDEPLFEWYAVFHADIETAHYEECYFINIFYPTGRLDINTTRFWDYILVTDRELPPGVYPHAVAGNDTTMYDGHWLVLNGGNSFHDDTTILIRNYSWIVLRGDSFKEGHAGYLSATRLPPTDAPRQDTVILTIIDEFGQGSSDTMLVTVLPAFHDIAVTRIIQPAPGDTIQYCNYITPKVWAKNFGAIPEELVSINYEIFEGDSLRYSDWKVIDALAAGDSALVIFDSLHPDPGNYRIISFPDFEIEENPANDSTASFFHVSPQVVVRCKLEIDQIEPGVSPGAIVPLPVYMRNPEEVGGFNFNIEFDPTVFTLLNVSRGPIIDSIDFWFGKNAPHYRFEKFYTEQLFSTDIHKRKVKLVGLYDVPDGYQGYPIAPRDSQEVLLYLKFQVKNDATLKEMKLPVRWEWDDSICTENVKTDPSGYILYVSIDTTQFNPHVCDTTGPNTQIIRNTYFIDGGIRVRDDGLNWIGDVNVNEYPYEIADAVLFSRYFIEGIDVFMTDAYWRDIQINATDVNWDGYTLTISDLVYLIRIVLELETPFGQGHKISPPTEMVEVTASTEGDRVVISSNCELPIGAGLFVFRHSGVSDLKVTTDMEMKYADTGSELRVLLWSTKGNSIPTGSQNLFSFVGKDVELVKVEAADNLGRNLNTVISAKAGKQIPTQFALSQNYPNPFNLETQISFDLPDRSLVSLKIYNIAGQLVKTLAEKEFEPGRYSISWDGTNQDGKSVSSGIYFYRLSAKDFVSVKRMVLIK